MALHLRGTDLFIGSRYNVVAGPEDRMLGTQHSVLGVIYRGIVTLKGVQMLAFEGPVFWALVEPDEVVELTPVKRRFEL